MTSVGWGHASVNRNDIDLWGTLTAIERPLISPRGGRNGCYLREPRSAQTFRVFLHDLRPSLSGLECALRGAPAAEVHRGSVFKTGNEAATPGSFGQPRKAQAFRVLLHERGLLIGP